VLVSEMITDGIETLVGITRDEVYGPVVVFGMGGTLAEVLHDVAYRVAPFGPDEARDMIGELRTRAVFDGVRGAPAADVEALVDALVKVSQFAWAQRECVAEVDINPLLVRPIVVTEVGNEGKGVVAADAVVVPRAVKLG